MKREKDKNSPPPEKIVAALASVCKANDAPWPIEINAYGTTPQAYTQAVLMEIRSTLATGLNWVALKKFVAQATGNADDLGADWSLTYRKALDLVYVGLGTDKDAEDDDVVIRDSTFDLWQIKKHPKGNTAMATAKKTAAPTTAPTAPTVKTKKSGKPVEPVATAKAKPEKSKPEKAKETAKGPTPRDLGYLCMVFDLLGDLQSSLGEFKKKAPEIAEALEHVTNARDALYNLEGLEG